MLEAVEDGWVDSLNPALNHGSDGFLFVGVLSGQVKGMSAPRKLRSFVAFDLLGALPPGASVAGAWLYGYPTTLSNPDAAVIFRNAATFEESTLTWQNQPSAATVPSPLVWHLPPSAWGWTAQEVTAFVEDCMANRGGQCSWQLRWVNEVDNTVTAVVAFQSKEEQSAQLLTRRMYLEVHYVLP
ncbi:MAG: hypothetical protein KatS3mg076_2018 [Candidatus Binatia bacterium]|nr:MAG: hypothetical protein KatS3mg076_2018 [Candidatus Binatia bacterium]